MPRYKAVIFDLDGTLLDTLDDLTAACNHALSVHGFPTHTREEVKGFVGNGIQLLMSRALPAGKDDALPAALAEFKAYYAAHNAVYTAPYPGIPELLKRLRAAGVLCGIVSNKNDPNVKALAEAFFPGLISPAVGEKEGIRKKPAPDSVQAVLKEWGLSPADALYVGDSDVDVETAANASCPCAAVLWGFRDEACLREAGAERLFASAASLGDFVLNPKD